MHGRIYVMSEREPRTDRWRARLSRFGNSAWLLLFVANCFAFEDVRSAASQSSTLEYQVKAAFLLNFTKFVEWPSPEPADSPFTVCVVGDDSFSPELERTVQGESVNGHKVVVQRASREGAKGCRLLFVSKSEKNIKELLNTVGPGVLTIGEGESFLHDGGVIAFIRENRRVRFSVNLAAARTEHLNLSSKLLAVARSVEN
jgi:YfiR/HmsC-like